MISRLYAKGDSLLECEAGLKDIPVFPIDKSSFSIILPDYPSSFPEQAAGNIGSCVPVMTGKGRNKT